MPGSYLDPPQYLAVWRFLSTVGRIRRFFEKSGDGKPAPSKDQIDMIKSISGMNKGILKSIALQGCKDGKVNFNNFSKFETSKNVKYLSPTDMLYITSEAGKGAN